MSQLSSSSSAAAMHLGSGFFLSYTQKYVIVSILMRIFFPRNLLCPYTGRLLIACERAQGKKTETVTETVLGRWQVPKQNRLSSEAEKIRRRVFIVSWVGTTHTFYISPIHYFIFIVCVCIASPVIKCSLPRGTCSDIKKVQQVAPVQDG